MLGVTNRDDLAVAVEAADELGGEFIGTDDTQLVV